MVEKRPKVGLGVIVVKDGKILLHQRNYGYQKNSWALPGGHLEFKESFEDCAARETEEESEVKIKNVRFAAVTNDWFKEDHYITVFMIANWESGEPKVMEPDKCNEWRWVKWDKMPQPVFLPLKNLIEQGYNPFS